MTGSEYTGWPQHYALPSGPVAITPACEKAEMVTCWSETQTTGGLGKHKDGGLLDRKALVPGLQAAVRSPRAQSV